MAWQGGQVARRRAAPCPLQVVQQAASCQVQAHRVEHRAEACLALAVHPLAAFPSERRAGGRVARHAEAVHQAAA